MAVSIEQQLNLYIHQLNNAQKKSLLGFIKTLFPGKEEQAAIEQYNKELSEAEAEISRGDMYTNEDVFELSERLINAGKKG